MCEVTPGVTGKSTVNVFVKPSIAVIYVGFGQLGMNEATLVMMLTELTVTGVLVPGKKATSLPLTKKPKTSGKPLETGGANSGYSSEPKAYWKMNRLPPLVVRTSKSRVAASKFLTELGKSLA